MALNLVLIRGRLTRDPEYKVTSGGRALASFTVAVNERRAEGQEHTEYVDVECWNRLAEAARDHLCRGRGVFVRGSWRMRSWDTDSGKRSRVVVAASDVEFLAKPQAAGAEREGGGS